MSAQHTPGPWEAIPHPKDWVVKQRVTTFTETRFPATVARVERDANARLIAAAPELLAALKAMDAAWCDGFDTHDTRMNGRRVLIAARAVIAKATDGEL